MIFIGKKGMEYFPSTHPKSRRSLNTLILKTNITRDVRSKRN